MRKKYAISLAITFLLTYSSNVIAQAEMNAKTQVIVKSKYGSADGEFGLKVFEDQSWAEPSGIAVDLKGNIYIADPLNNRIQKFDKTGKFMFKISLNIQKKLQRFGKTINDITVDREDNLYAVSGHEQRIFKYNEVGQFIQSISLKEMDIAWDRWRGWRSGIYLQPKRISVDKIGNIYLESSNELIKFSKEGKLSKKWVREGGSNEASYFIEQTGLLYFSRQIGVWEKYDQNGNLLGTVVCEKEPLSVYIPTAGGQCQFPPKFIDKNGLRYYFELTLKTSDLISIVKVDQSGNLKRYKAPPVDIWQSPNMIKFDDDGYLYGYDYDNTKQEYWVIRMKLE
ncbi:MAG TPA: hypothetical protein VII00_05480 [bacterium]